MQSKFLNLTFLPFISLISVSVSVFASDTSANNNLSPDVFKLTSSEIRTYHQGDAIYYQSRIAGSGAALSGELKQSISNTITNPSGKKCLEHTVSSNYSGIGNETALDVRMLYHQDTQNSLHECGFYDNKTASYVFITDTENTPDGLALSIQSPLNIGNTTSTLVTYTDGTWKDCTRAIQSIENVKTGAGRYESYKINETCSNSASNSNTQSDMWFVPSIYTVKESGAGEIIAGDFILESFSFD